eukprot:PhF_6_TR15907/c2_g2_i4/m.24550
MYFNSNYEFGQEPQETEKEDESENESEDNTSTTSRHSDQQETQDDEASGGDTEIEGDTVEEVADPGANSASAENGGLVEVQLESAPQDPTDEPCSEHQPAISLPVSSNVSPTVSAPPLVSVGHISVQREQQNSQVQDSGKGTTREDSNSQESDDSGFGKRYPVRVRRQVETYSQESNAQEVNKKKEKNSGPVQNTFAQSLEESGHIKNPAAGWLWVEGAGHTMLPTPMNNTFSNNIIPAQFTPTVMNPPGQATPQASMVFMPQSGLVPSPQASMVVQQTGRNDEHQTQPTSYSLYKQAVRNESQPLTNNRPFSNTGSTTCSACGKQGHW